ncbi:HPt (histidine-containing phosphotransfer) domain-containing protein [Mesonia phycicola]|uniref:HPt (Histidine-containing phosphotransfer) domain-containing protein n=1 Tax=Mesonia phycicola TaxID=579105 RepID=A0A1M6E0C6_9FLAO|nr:Hpt domain-containing protein [Mesonia phycicola]SHI78957.1 HPt (histidine-containing phosphotransfer) domain-containing protein [Mesonia phycicola]
MKPYNLEELRLLADGDEDFFIEMLKTFTEELPNDIIEMNNAIDNGNASLAYQVAHKMKPNLQMFGLDLGQHIKVLEQWFKSSLQLEEVLPHAKTISSKVNLVCSELKQDYNL